MVEPHLVIPEAEIKRLEEFEKKYNQLKHDIAKSNEKFKSHTCDHSECEKKIADLKDKYEKAKTSSNNKEKNSDEEKDSDEEISHPSTSKSYYGPASTEYDPKNIQLQEPLPKKTKSSEAEVSSSSTSNKPWYYIGPME